jgi:hypothetical protein
VYGIGKTADKIQTIPSIVALISIIINTITAIKAIPDHKNKNKNKKYLSRSITTTQSKQLLSTTASITQLR